MRELKPLLVAIGGNDVTIYEDRSRPNYLMEVFRFKDEAEFTAFDDKFHKDRKIAAIYALLDDIVEAEKSDCKIFERRLESYRRARHSGQAEPYADACLPRSATASLASSSTSWLPGPSESSRIA